MQVDLLQLQKRAFQNKVNHDFNTTDVQLEMLLLHSELAELFNGYLKQDLDNMKEELADIMIYVLGIAEMLDVNLAEEVLKKMDINERRVYHSDGTKTIENA